MGAIGHIMCEKQKVLIKVFSQYADTAYKHSGKRLMVVNTINNCRLCGRLHKINRQCEELCYECMVMHEAQYKVTLHRIEKIITREGCERITQTIGYEPQRVQVYLAHRFQQAPKYFSLEGQRRGYCYICNFKVYYASESACLDCMHRMLAILENRNLCQTSRMGTGQLVQLVLNGTLPASAEDSYDSPQVDADDNAQTEVNQPNSFRC